MSERDANTGWLNRMLERERAARREAEQTLEIRARELFEANRSLQDREQYSRAVFEAIQDGILIVDDQWVIEAANPIVSSMTRDVDIVGRPISEVLIVEDDALLSDRFEAGLIRSDRSILAVRVTRSAISLGGTSKRILVVHDLTEERATASALRRTAFMDQLTGLGNRASMVDRYETRAAAPNAPTFAVLVLDIQRFGRINDALGRASGDLALREIALRLRDHARGVVVSEPRLSEFVVTRIGGDEFAILMRGVEIKELVEQQITSLLETVGRPFTLAGVPIAVDMHVGYCFGEEAEGDVNAVLDRAVFALETVSELRIGAVAEYQPEMSADRRRVVGLENRILQGLEAEEFVVHFQPRLDITTGRITSGEALLRWHHPERGILLPGEFIGIAEQSALIVALDDLVLSRVLGLAQRLQSLGLSSHFSINVSGIEFAMLGFADKVSAKVAESGINPAMLEFEIKESVITSDVTHAIEVIESFGRRGFAIALDDFGTGHSSLNRLTELRVDVIKLDQRFLWGATTGVDSRKILEALVALAAAVDAQLVVEGAETADHLDLLRSIGVQFVQGYAISPAVDQDTYVSYLQRQPWTASAVGSFG